jgi:predicted NBD/HSP70 family sugar kinase
MLSLRAVLVFDLGGTTLRAGWFVGGTLTAVARMSADAVRAGGDPAVLLDNAIASLAAEVLAGEPAAVSLAVPGPVDGGVAGRLPSLLGPTYRGGLDFAAMAQRLWPGRPVVVANDLTAAGALYVARGHRDFGVLTLGSGVGGKLFVDGRPLLGPTGYGGEIGHWRVPGAPPTACDCGGTGHLSALASGRGSVRLAQWRAAQDPSGFKAAGLGEATALTPEALVAAFHGGNSWARACLEASAEALGAALAACSLAAGLELFFLTGGFAVAAGEAFRAMTARAAAEHAWATGPDWDGIVRLADADEEPGLLGAGHLALRTSRIN